MTDEVNNPSHYNQAGIQVIDVIETYTPNSPHLANVIKYVCRHSYKGKPLQDLKKAQWYLNRAIDLMEDVAAERIDNTYVQPSPDRIAGDDEVAKRIKGSYYDFDATEAISQCANPACRMVITTADTPIVDAHWRSFCSLVCLDLVNR